MLTRRSFLQRLAAVAAAAGLAPLAKAASALPDPERRPLANEPAQVEPAPRWCRAVCRHTGGISDFETTVEFSADGVLWRPGDGALIVRTNEAVRVVSVGRETLTVERGAGGTKPQAILDRDWLLRF